MCEKGVKKTHGAGVGFMQCFVKWKYSFKIQRKS